MQIRTITLTDAACAARLLIHTGLEREVSQPCLAALMGRLRAFGRLRPGHESQVPGLEIHDLQGQRILAVRQPSPLVEVFLPPGTYHISSRVEGVCRRYTITLEAGSSVHLRLGTARNGHSE